jgi:hypothetical protein
MIPRQLEDWTVDALVDLLARGVFEPESFDYKEALPHPRNEQDKSNVRKDCCAFANTLGGFLVYGVKDDRTLPMNARLIGVDEGLDFPRDFGSFPAGCRPSVTWHFKNPPLRIANGKVAHVIFIPRSWRAPHSLASERPQEGFLFPKRTNKGNEYMSYEEVRNSFLQYYEKRLKLHLLQSELDTIARHVQMNNVSDETIGQEFGIWTIPLNVIETVLSDAYTLLAERPDIISALMTIRTESITANNKMQMLFPIRLLPLDGGAKYTLIKEHNLKLRPVWDAIKSNAIFALSSLKELTNA